MYHIINADIKFCLEVTRRTRVDTHGGVLLSYNDRPMLMEAIQVPKSRKDEFKKMATRFQTFNTNNMWVNLSDVKVRCVAALPVPLAVHAYRVGLWQRLVVANLVHLEPIPAFYDVKGKRALQLETSPGSAIRVRRLPHADVLCIRSPASSSAVLRRRCRARCAKIAVYPREVHISPPSRAEQSL